MKACTKCGERKTLAEFYRCKYTLDGRRSQCSSCTKEEQGQYYLKNASGCREYAREYRRKRPEKRTDCQRRSYKKHRQKILQEAADYRKTHRKEILARRAVELAILRGEMTRGTTCGRCQVGGVAIAGHHVDYGEPLEVQWLCYPCHGLLHRIVDKEGE